MDLAGLSDTLNALAHQIGVLTQTVQGLQTGQDQLRANMRELQGAPPPYQAPMELVRAQDPQAPEPPVPLPERFTGDRSKYITFRTACQIMFTLKPRTYHSENIKIQTIISLLSGEPQTWAHHLILSNSPTLDTWTSFITELDTLYDDPLRKDTAERALRATKQGRRPVEEYISEFKTHALDTEWNEAALISQYRLGLSEQLKDELSRGDLPHTLEALMQLTLTIDRRMRERRLERNPLPMGAIRRPPRALPSDAAAVVPYYGGETREEPMQLGATSRRLPPEELDRRRALHLCLYCASPNHFRTSCPERNNRGGKGAPSHNPSNPCFPLHLSLLISLQWSNKTVYARAMVDSGASGCFMDMEYAETINIPKLNKETPINIHMVDGSLLRSGTVTSETQSVQMTIGNRHLEPIRFDLVASPVFPVILGLPWLRLHNPLIHWEPSRVRFQSLYCKKHCMLIPQIGFLNSVLDKNMRKTNIEVPKPYLEYADVFNKQGVETLPPHRAYDCPIDLVQGATIPHGRLYPLSQPELTVLKEYIRENLDKGFIRPSTSPAGAGIFFVSKKDGGLRPCVDYRELNDITIKNRYPLPLIPELMERLQDATIFTKLDLRGAYNLVRIQSGHEWKTAFRSRYGHYEYLVMPYGLCNAPATFQHFINDVFKDLLDQYVVVYLDDILVYSKSTADHRVHMKEVLSRLRKHLLYVKTEKCIFDAQTISFLGFILSPGHVTMDPEKVTAITTWPIPTSKKEIQRFLGFSSFYRRFIRDFSKLARPLTRLTSNKTKFYWSDQADNAFQALKKRFSSAPILSLPNPTQPFFLEVDASEYATGAILSQRDTSSSLLHPIAFHSKIMDSAEQNYDVGDKELLAIKKALEEWRHLLEGTHHPVTIYTDHRNLEYLRSAKRLRPRQARWALFFSRFNFHITYRPGRKNMKADTLSRLPPAPTKVQCTDTILHSDHFLSATTIDTPTPSHKELLELCHDSPSAGHGGIKKTEHLMHRYGTWPHMKKEIKKYVTTCSVCARSKHSTDRTSGLLQPIPTPSRPWTQISVDFITDLPPSKGYTTIMVVVDHFTKMAHFVGCKGLPTAVQTATMFHNHIFRLHGTPTSIISDRGSQFTSRFWKALCKSLHISSRLSSAFHPQTNGQTERTNQTLEQYLRCYSTQSQDNWMNLLPTAEFAYNNGFHSSLKTSPFYTAYGYHPVLLPGSFRQTHVPDVNALLRHHRRHLALLKQNLLNAKQCHKNQADKKRRIAPSYRVGQKVWLSSRNIRLLCPSKKLGPKFIGPYVIDKVVNASAVRLRLPPNFRIHPTFHVSLVKPWTPDPFRKTTPPPPVSAASDPEYEVQAIIDSRWRGRSLQYLIQWKGYGPEERSWEPASGISAVRLVRRFHLLHPTKPAPGRPRSGRLGGGLCQDSPQQLSALGTRRGVTPRSGAPLCGGSGGR
uniref:Gypsy retrotransposon integrase-like protein 1 n=1 Tax=Leptobrachium leishanense TaxID=445787 RepID=A0A8C5M117_9ANUR